jgi:hypothetical protein
VDVDVDVDVDGDGDGDGNDLPGSRKQEAGSGRRESWVEGGEVELGVA